MLQAANLRLCLRTAQLRPPPSGVPAAWVCFTERRSSQAYEDSDEELSRGDRERREREREARARERETETRERER
eukprot:1032346-Rhodomonas_salina.1